MCNSGEITSNLNWIFAKPQFFDSPLDVQWELPGCMPVWLCGGCMFFSGMCVTFVICKLGICLGLTVFLPYKCQESIKLCWHLDRNVEKNSCLCCCHISSPGPHLCCHITPRQFTKMKTMWKRFTSAFYLLTSRGRLHWLFVWHSIWKWAYSTLDLYAQLTGSKDFYGLNR